MCLQIVSTRESTASLGSYPKNLRKVSEVLRISFLRIINVARAMDRELFKQMFCMRTEMCKIMQH